MEPVQRIIIGNHVYDVNDDELEIEVTEYLKVLTQKQKIAKDGKAAIITATQNKTGKPITTNTYAEVIDKINSFESKTFTVPYLMFRPYYKSFPPAVTQQIVDNKVVRFKDYETLTNVGDVAFYMYADRNKLHIPPNVQSNYKLEVQVNLDFGTAEVEKTPIICINDNVVNLCKVSDTEMYLQGGTFTGSWAQDTKPVIDISDFHYFSIVIEHLANAPFTNALGIHVYGGTRAVEKTANSGYKPAIKKLLFSIPHYSSNQIKDLICGKNWLSFQVSGCVDSLYNTKSFGHTALHVHDFGVRLSDDYTTSTIGNTNFLDMEVAT